MQRYSAMSLSILSILLISTFVLAMDNNAIGGEGWSPFSPTLSSFGPSPFGRSHSTNRLPTDEEFSEALLSGSRPHGSGAGSSSDGLIQPAAQLTANELFHDGDQVHPFTTADGRTWGPLLVGRQHFQSRPYPLDMPLFRSTIHYGHFHPVNFEHYLDGNTLLIDNTLFRPSPDILQRIQERVVPHLRSAGWTARLIPGYRPEDHINEGEFLWPPVRAHPDQATQELRMSANIRQRLRFQVVNAVQQHRSRQPTIWKLTLPSAGDGAERHIMMTQVHPSNADSPLIAHRADFWVFHEALADLDKGGVASLGLLGGMFLPKSASLTLSTDGVIQPALAGLLWHAY